MGISRTISMSNTKKMIANIKNRKEKGIRAFELGSKPHSKDEAFSRSIIFREFNVLATINSKVVIAKAKIIMIDGIIIIWGYMVSSFD